MPGNEAALPTLASSTSATLAPEQITPRTSYGLEVRWYEYRGTCVIVAAGEYDMGSVTPLQEALHTAAKRYPKVVLETSGVTFADSSFLDLLLLTHQMGTLRLVAPSAQVRRLCELTGVDSVLVIRQTIEDATAA
ncbi:anti-anti-sigma factor [Streptomyces alfalfae]|uniref:Anti-anti-sigma factor n=1 Tax=Streptomyces alfalfae TaxID=1642299 RepID=A0ABM6GLD5_9ACTN|nr:MULTISPECIES: STAS domain-containing protein [Streptomyces]APY84567.1 anti-anti-sigma factor [Streptomyces alfalfae]